MLAAAAVVVVCAGAALGQTQPAQTGVGTELAPDRAAAPQERPAETAPPSAERAPAPAPRPGDTAPVDAGEEDRGAEGVPAGTGSGATADEPAGGAVPEAAHEPPAGPEAPVQAPAPEEVPGAPDAAPAPAEGPEAEAPAPPEPPMPQQLAEDDAELAACIARLAAFGATFERIDPIDEQGGACGIVNPLRVTEPVPGVRLEPAGVMRCETATALAAWLATFVLPASRMLPERGSLTAVEHASTYVCRPVGNSGGELSEHASGNAVDVMAFRFAEGAPIRVEPRERDGTAAETFQRAARATACLLFTTVIGPGEEDHDDHLHLDIAARSSGYRLCQ
jgi:hypothetical protein